MLNEVRRVVPPEPTAAAIDARIARMRQRFSSPDELSRALAASGVDETVLRIYAADDLRLASYLDERFSSASQPTDEEIRQSRRSRAGEAGRRAPADARRRMDCRLAPARRRHGPAVSQTCQRLLARNTNISAALNPEWLTTGATMLRRVR